jgi:DNA-binding SARP family transcriptional activator/tetratricopeptide (TPR) repeat protein
VIRINALGGLSVRDGKGNPFPGAAAQPRRMAILALLARAGQRGITREKLLSLLWPDADDERGPRTLAQALYALRKDLGADDAITGSKELRLDPALVSTDVAEFTSAVSRGDDERAVALYHGPFLDGFHLPGADEFSRWVDVERAAIAQEYSRTLESLARVARSAGDARAAVGWWRKLAALEPLNARVTVGLMDALAAAGDRAGAIQHARVYELLVEQELDLPADRDVLAFAERLRREADVPAKEAHQIMSELAPGPPAEPIARRDAPSIDQPIARPRGHLLPHWGIAGVAALIILGVAFVTRSRWVPTRRPLGATESRAVVAIGHIVSFGADSAQANMAAPVADLLTTSLARVKGIRVVSHGRMLELMRSSGTVTDTSAGGFVNAARQAGATELIDGTLFTRPGGRLRLDLRRVDIGSGAIGDVHTIEGNDLFALIDSGTARLVATLGGDAPRGSVADVTTRSIAAYRMYEQGIRAYYRGEVHSALGFFDAALAEDSLFALAAYYDALSDPVPRSYVTRMERARRLATRATDRERLTILAGWAYSASSPTLREIAETLATRYPAEIEGHLYFGIARVYDGDFLGGLAPLERVITMDSLGLRGDGARCGGCDALRWRVSAYELADSLPAAEREARRWLRLQPRSKPAGDALIEAIERQGRAGESDSIFRATAPADLPYDEVVDYEIAHLIRLGDFGAADRLLATRLRQGNTRQQSDAYWTLVIALREQGRFIEALDAAKHTRRAAADIPHGATRTGVLEAQVDLEMGRFGVARLLFDSLSHVHNPGDVGSQLARATVWMLAQAGGARRSAGDTATLERLADSIRVLGAESGYGRDRRLHHHVRGILLAARGDDAGAISELKSAIYSLTEGYTRTNYELARVYLRDHRVREAIAALQPVLRGTLEASNLYLNRTEVHELLAQAWDAAGVRDSAATHYAWVTKAWAAADPSLTPRLQAARTRLAALQR